MSTRSAVAEAAGFNNIMSDKLKHHELDDFTPGQRAAVELADAMMTLPGAIGSELVAELRRQFSEEQILELTLDVMKWSHQKIKVALGIDEPLAPAR
jgi:alkylhydroperoxidase family enzyme